VARCRYADNNPKITVRLLPLLSWGIQARYEAIEVQRIATAEVFEISRKVVEVYFLTRNSKYYLPSWQEPHAIAYHLVGRALDKCRIKLAMQHQQRPRLRGISNARAGVKLLGSTNTR